MNERPLILIVDDEPFNVDYLEQELADLDYDTISAFNGQEALAQVAAHAPDMVLLDVMMPLLDGFGVLARLKADKQWRDIPVVVISANNDMGSVVRGIEMGAEDYLPKPFDPVLLQARMSAGLERKRLRDQEVEYLRQVEQLTDAAGALENNTFTPESLTAVAARADALGNLARVFQRMARQVYEREQRLQRQLAQLRLDIAEQRQAAAETVALYLPMDRRHALASGHMLPDQAQGTVLMADIAGFTPLTEALARELGFQRGAEELTRHLNRVFGALVDQVHHCGGSVLNFSGDAITCWFDGNYESGIMNDEEEVSSDLHNSSLIIHNSSLRAGACGLAMQAAMHAFATVVTPAGTTVSFGLKVAVVSGTVRRFLVGDPAIQQIEALAGHTLDELARCERQAARGEVVVGAAVAADLDQHLVVAAWRGDEYSERCCAVVTGLRQPVDAAPWPALPAGGLVDEQVRPWLLPPVYERVQNGQSAFLAELRPAAALFLSFRGINYDHDPDACQKLDQFVRWVQATLARFDGFLLQLTMGDKGSYLYGVFGAPVAHDDDAARAVAAALMLQAPPANLDFIHAVKIGLAYGQMRAGAYGGAGHRTYGVLGDKTNLAARLMQAATDGILCDEALYRQAQTRWRFVPLPAISVKGKADPVAVYRPTGANRPLAPAIDALPAEQQLTLKVASVIGRLFTLDLLHAVYPVAADRAALGEQLSLLTQAGLIEPYPAAPAYAFIDTVVHQAAYNLMLFAQRRQLHRAVAEWIERVEAADLSPHYALLAHHWGQAEDTARTVYYLERAGEQARRQGAYEEALGYFNQSLARDSEE
jgi:CheY-like chemotaxis protein